VTQRYLWREYERATQAQITRDCREGCTNCGARELIDCHPERMGCLIGENAGER
jgi:hypothetical protein